MDCAPTSNPATRTVPVVGGKNPVRTRISVVLPEPFGPSSPTTSPRRTCNETPARAQVAPKYLVRSCASIIVSIRPIGPIGRIGPIESLALDPSEKSDDDRQRRSCRQSPKHILLQIGLGTRRAFRRQSAQKEQQRHYTQGIGEARWRVMATCFGDAFGDVKEDRNDGRENSDASSAD